MKSREDIKKWLLDNALDEMGDLCVYDLDFRDFDGNIYLNRLKSNEIISNSGQEANYIYNTYQKATEINNYCQKIITKHVIEINGKK